MKLYLADALRRNVYRAHNDPTFAYAEEWRNHYKKTPMVETFDTLRTTSVVMAFARERGYKVMLVGKQDTPLKDYARVAQIYSDVITMTVCPPVNNVLEAYALLDKWRVPNLIPVYHPDVPSLVYGNDNLAVSSSGMSDADMRRMWQLDLTDYRGVPQFNCWLLNARKIDDFPWQGIASQMWKSTGFILIPASESLIKVNISPYHRSVKTLGSHYNHFSKREQKQVKRTLKKHGFKYSDVIECEHTRSLFNIVMLKKFYKKYEGTTINKGLFI